MINYNSPYRSKLNDVDYISHSRKYYRIFKLSNIPANRRLLLVDILFVGSLDFFYRTLMKIQILAGCHHIYYKWVHLHILCCNLPTGLEQQDSNRHRNIGCHLASQRIHTWERSKYQCNCWYRAFRSELLGTPPFPFGPISIHLHSIHLSNLNTCVKYTCVQL